MEIKIGKYTLKADRYGVWLEQEVKGKKGKSEGKDVQRRITGYYRDFSLLLDDFIDSRVKDSDANNMKQVLAEIDSALKDAKRIARETIKADFHIVKDTRKEKK